jgi:outer membrane protein
MLSALTLYVALGAAAADLPGSADVPTGPSLTLARAEQNALGHQPTIRQAEGQTEAAAGRVEEARAGYLPQVGVTGTYQRTTGNFVSRAGVLPQTNMNVVVNTAVGWDPKFDYWSFALTGSQLIYDFNATADRWRAASASRDAAEANVQATGAQALLNVRRAYFQARGQRDLVRVAEETVANQQKHLDQIQNFVAAGMRSQIDLATARTALANARVQLVTAVNGYAAGLALLDQAMGQPTDERYDLTDNELPPVEGEDADAHTLIERAVKARPEITVAERNRSAQERTVDAFRGSYGPALSAAAGLTDAGASLGKLTPNWFVGLTASWALLQGGLTTGQVREARGTLAALTAQEETVRLQVSVEFEQGRLAVVAAKSSIAAAEEALASAREQLKLAEARYETGQGSVIELADAQVAQTSAAAQEVGARYGLASARAQLLAALGVR